MYERFSDRARNVVQLSNQEAQRFNHEYIGTEHVLLGLIRLGSGAASEVLKHLNVDPRAIRLEVEKLILSGPDMITGGKLPQTPRAKRIIEHAMEEAGYLNDNYIGTEHILLGFLRDRESVAYQVLLNLGLNPEGVREAVVELPDRRVLETDDMAKSERQPDVPEPVWVATTLWLLPVPIFAFAASAVAATAALICSIWASSEHSAVGWTLCVILGSSSGLIALASVARYVHRRRNAIDVIPRYKSSEQRPTGAIIVLLIWVYSWMLIFGLHIFRNFFAANAPGGVKYYVTLGIAVVSSLYMAIHGRRVLRERIGPRGGRNIALTSGQALLVALLAVGLGMYFAWIMF